MSATPSLQARRRPVRGYFTMALAVLVALGPLLGSARASSVNAVGTCPGVTVTQGDSTSGCRVDTVAPANTLNDFGNLYNKHWHDYAGGRFLVNASGGVVAGDVLAIDPSGTAKVGLSDTQTSRFHFVVAQGTIADTASGEFAIAGVSVIKSTGTINVGEYIRKSATSRAVESTGVAEGTTTLVPDGSIGIAISSASGGFVTAILFGRTVTVDTPTAGANITVTPGTRIFTIASGASAIDAQIFTASGTWSKPAGITLCTLQTIGAGGSGAGGRGGSAAASTGGGGGGGVAITTKVIKAADLGATETVTVGATTTGGAANTDGAVGASSSFGSHLVSYGGGGGDGTGSAGLDTFGGAGGGSASAGPAATGSAVLGGAPMRLTNWSIGGGGAGQDLSAQHGWPAEYGGGSGGGGGSAATGTDGGTSLYCGAGGGAGGAGGSGTARTGGNGGASGVWTDLGGGGGAGGAGGASPAAGTAGTAGSTAKCGGGGGGGGGTITGGTAGAVGGAGGIPGGGGGGGGGGVSAGGVGGAGGRGEVRAYCW